MTRQQSPTPDAADTKRSNETTVTPEELAQLIGNADAAEGADAEEHVGDAKRTLGGPFAHAVTALTITWSIFQIATSATGALGAMDLRAWHALFLVALAILIFKPFKRASSESKIWLWVDIALMAIAVSPFAYFLLQYKTIALRGGYLQPIDYAFGILGLIVVFEVARRAVRNLAILAAAFVAYLFIGPYIPGVFGHAGYTIERITQQLFWGSQGIFGIAIGVSATFVFAFILFGAFLKISGFGNFISEFSLALTGHTSGGPAKVAVLASALTGTINGSALANVATTGAITIPLMKRNGYPARFAAAVEAVASTGGQFAPPVMGAVGFVMAEYLGVPYSTVMIAAIIPATLYYFAILMAVHFEAKKRGLKGLSKENLPAAGQVLRKQGHLSLPLIALIAMLMSGFTPLLAGIVGILVAVLSSWIRKDTRMSLRDIAQALEEGARGALGVGIACLCIGIIIGVVSLTGLGLNVGYAIMEFTSGSLLVTSLLVMVMSIILGMGVPGVAAYVVVAAVGAPILIDSGAAPLAAHMFILFFASLSNITPPVALASYIAAGLANENETKVSLTAVKIGLVGFIFPFLFIFNEDLLMTADNPWSSITPFATAALGVLVLAAGLQGWFLTRIRFIPRVLLVAAALFMMVPGFMSDMIGLAVAGAILALATILNNRTKSHV